MKPCNRGLNLFRNLAPVAFAVALPACFDMGTDRSGVDKTPGITEPCYFGPPGTAGVGQCRQGFNINFEAESGEIESLCFGQVLPAEEACNGADDDCDGASDEGDVCAQDVLAELQRSIPDIHAVMVPGRTGPAFVVRRGWGAMFPCAEDATTRACALEFFASNGMFWGLDDPQSQLLPGSSGGEKSDRSAGFAQAHKGIPVEGRWLSVARVFPPDARGNALVNVRGSIATLDADVPTEPAFPPEEAFGYLTDGPEPIGDAVLVFVEVDLPLDAASPDSPNTAWKLAYRVDRGDDGLATDRLWLDATTGEVLREVSLVVQDQRTTVTNMTSGLSWSDQNSPPTSPPSSEADALAAWQVTQDWTQFLLDTGVVNDGDDWRKPDNLHGAIHYEVRINDQDDCCAERSCAAYHNGSGGYVATCPGFYDDETMAHELGHLLARRYWPGHYLNSQEHDALVETFSQVFAEFWQCRQQDCQFLHNGIQDFKRLTRVGALANPWIAAAEDEGSSPTKYEDARVPGSALHQVYVLIMQRVASPDSSDVAVRVTMALAVWSLQYLGVAQPGGASSQYLEFIDFYTALATACTELAGRSQVVGAGSSAPWTITQAECLDISTAFSQVGIVSACQIPMPVDVCNGFDDDCDGLVDEDTEGNPLTTHCYDGPAWTENVGECRPGSRKCTPTTNPADCMDETLVDGQLACWSAFCDGQRLPRPTDPFGSEDLLDCNHLDDDCDGVVDDGAQTEFAYDGDGDGFPGVAPHRFWCVGDQEARWRIWDPEIPDDCNDQAPAVNPGAEELCSNTFDDNCNGLSEEGCECVPFALPQFCGPPLCGGLWDPDPADNPYYAQPWCECGKKECVFNPLEHLWTWDDVCLGAQFGGPEVCNSVDDDCDGLTDEDLALGRCGFMDTGHEACVAGQIVCLDEGTPNVCGGLAGEIALDPAHHFELHPRPGDSCDYGGGFAICTGPNSMTCVVPPAPAIPGGTVLAWGTMSREHGLPTDHVCQDRTSYNIASAECYFLGGEPPDFHGVRITFERPAPSPDYLVFGWAISAESWDTTLYEFAATEQTLDGFAMAVGPGVPFAPGLGRFGVVVIGRGQP